jgi:hypothetical protein
MTDVLDRLTKALADRYAIEREHGSGGMATVHLADATSNIIKKSQSKSAGVLAGDLCLHLRTSGGRTR